MPLILPVLWVSKFGFHTKERACLKEILQQYVHLCLVTTPEINHVPASTNLSTLTFSPVKN